MVRQLLFALVAGALLSAMRAPAGLDLTQVPAVDATTAAFFRAGALAAIALLIDPRRTAFRGGARELVLATGALFGFALHGLFALTRFEPWCRLGFGLGLIGATLLLGLLAGRRRQEDEAPASATASAPGRLESAGLVVVGAGLALALGNVERHVRLFTLGLREDGTVVGIAILAALLLGALAFGRPLARAAWQRALVGGAASLAAGTTLVGLTFLAGLEPDPFFAYLSRFGIDLTSVGTWPSTALLGGAALVVPASLAGAGLSGARQPRRLSCLLFGTALGSILLPHLVRAWAEPLRSPALWHEPWAWRLCLTGAVVTGAGAVLVVWPGAGGSGRARWVGLAAVLAGVAMPLTGPRVATWAFSPWYRVPIEPILAMHVPEGLVTVEGERGGEKVVTLDRRLVSPTADELVVDARRLAYALSFLAPAAEGERPRLLFVGQMTPLRAARLEAVADVDRTAPWFDALEAVEAELFANAPAPRGELVSPREAKRRLADDAYDLVVVAPSRGPLFFPKSAAQFPWGATGEPVVAGLEVPGGTLAVVWLDASAPLQGRDLGERVLLAQDRFVHLSVGVLVGDLPPSPAAGGRRPALLPAGDPRPRPGAIAMLRLRPDWREAEAHRELAARLAEAAVGTEHEALAASLDAHYAIQERSSPFTSRGQQIQVGEEELQQLFQASAGDTLDPFTRSLWESEAWVLTEKRRIDLALVYLEPIAGRFGPWEVIDRALAHAYREFDMAADALPLIERHLGPDEVRLDLLVECAELASQAGEWAKAADYWGRAARIQQRDRFRIEQGKALVRAGDPDGRRLLEELLAEHPEDDSIPPYLTEDGPPPYEPGYRPDSDLDDGDHDH